MFDFLRTTFLTIILSSISIKCDNKYEALHFTHNTFPRLTFDLVLMKELDYPKLFYRSATACPAESEEEVAFNMDYSFGKKSMFVRNTYEENQTAQDVDYFICENPYKLSVLYHNKNVEFQFGTEIYFDKSKYGDRVFLQSHRGDYDLITNTHTYINYIKPFFYHIPRSVPYLSRLASLPLVSSFLQSPLYLDKNYTHELGFLWVDSFRMKFNFKAKRVAQTIYRLALLTRDFRDFRKCNDYDLGKEFFTGLDVDNLYGEDNQKRMLEGVKLPALDDNNYKEFDCVRENQCFAKWSTVPAEQFHHVATKSTSCSDLLTVPVWRSTIYEVLNKLDNFLFAISMVLGHPIGDLLIHSGVHGVLQLPTGSYLWGPKPITLAEKTIEAPDIIYKLVKYTVMQCPMPKDKLKKYYKLIRPKIKLEDIENEDNELEVSNSEAASITDEKKKY